MAKGTDYKSGRVEYDGAFVYAQSSGRITNAAAAVNGEAFVAPFSGTVKDYHVNIDTQFTHADAALAVGLLSDSDSLLDDYDLTNVATGYQNLIGNTLWVSKAITVGSLYLTAQLAASDTTGKLTAVIVIAPQ